MSKEIITNLDSSLKLKTQILELVKKFELDSLSELTDFMRFQRHWWNSVPVMIPLPLRRGMQRKLHVFSQNNQGHYNIRPR